MLPKVTSRVQQRNVLQTTTLRDFNGGLNVIDDDMNLSYKYAVSLFNCYAASDGSIQVRYGNKLFANLDGSVINIEYFNGALIAVIANGNVVKILGDGSWTTIWSTWSTTTFVSFAQFNGHLIICNGVDKPLDVNGSFVAAYLQDAATLSNINVPICKYVVSNNRFLVMTGDPLNAERVHISARDAVGTWYGDPAPNDGIHVDVGSVLAGATTIRGALSFRNKILILYAEGMIVGSLGTYDAAGNHTPNFDDAIEQYGCVSHRTAVARGDDGLFLDLEGIPSIKRTVLSSSLKPERASTLIDPEITQALNGLSALALEERTFAVYNHKEGQYLVCVPNNEVLASTTETTTFVYSYRPTLKQDGWSIFGGWNWTCGCRSLQGNIFFGDASGYIWLHGSRDNPILGDAVVDDPTLGVPLDAGSPIEFEWEMPWQPFGDRTKSKNSKYISFDARGNAEFDVEMFVDNGSAYSLTGTFLGGDATGSGRIVSYKKLFAWPAKFEIAKLKFSGSSQNPLAIVSVSVHYTTGSIRR